MGDDRGYSIFHALQQLLLHFRIEAVCPHLIFDESQYQIFVLLQHAACILCTDVTDCLRCRGWHRPHTCGKAKAPGNLWAAMEVKAAEKQANAAIRAAEREHKDRAAAEKAAEKAAKAAEKAERAAEAKAKADAKAAAEEAKKGAHAC